MLTSAENIKFEKTCCYLNLSAIMQKNAAVLTIVCVMMCLTFNYTFPLHRKKTDIDRTEYPNQTQVCNIPVHHETIAERSKKMATNIEQAFKRFKDSTQDFGKNIYDHVSSGLKEHINIINEEDLRQFEQMVIMKKYPYLDLKELDLKFRPAKNTRQSVTLENRPNSGNEPGLCESLDDSPNVEIINRGLSGFAIPPELSKHESSIEDKVRGNSATNKKRAEDMSKAFKKPLNNDVLESLRKEVKEYIENKNFK